MAGFPDLSDNAEVAGSIPASPSVREMVHVAAGEASLERSEALHRR